MDWLNLRFTSAMPESGQILLDCTHNPWLVALAYVVMCGASFATLNMAERATQADSEAGRRRWRGVGALCLAGGIWSLHFIAMLAFKAPVAIEYDLQMTLLSLLIVLVAAVLTMRMLSQRELRATQCLLAAVLIGLGIAAMHYSGMGAMRSSATLYYQPGLFALSIAIAILTSLAALMLGLYFRQGDEQTHQWLKYGASLVMGLAVASMHFTGMWSMVLVVPEGTPLQLQSANNSLQLALVVAGITLVTVASSLGAAWADRKLQHKERDLMRVNALLSQLGHAKASLQQIADFDALTNLLNRRGLNQAFAERLRDHAQRGKPLAVMFIDIDHFKRINDSLGHDAGDELLKVIAERLRGALRENDVIARFGGDEFCLLASLHSKEEARQLAQRMMLHLKDPISLAGRCMVMTASIGISLFPDDGTTSEELLKHADMALYQSKGSGRNNAHFFNAQLKAKAGIELQLEEELRLALKQEMGLQLYYQPILELNTGLLSKLEALLRWQHPEHGLLTPDRFIGIAEANGFIAELDNWVLHRACQDLHLLSGGNYPELKVAVNCSALNLSREALAREVGEALEIHGVPAQRLELEVTENALMGNVNLAVDLLQQIRELGVSLSIDDFGTGYSSLAYLRRLPLDTLKIDRSFIQDIPTSTQGMDIIQAIIGMAHTLRLRVVAEGVENEQQLAFLRKHGCDFIQGYLLSKPLSLEALQAFLLQHREPIKPARLLSG
ncbi:bifunctional diguanylate cyclase/phosphodiesterase [Pseudomonas sp. GD03944]|uniref:putative bifunctional diguanylate cyclase/phosphodiesterase n=1 Tax=Pseudomonas sp. GD03944 TaxID=2975409 RepID=UPI00244CB16F|nr:bifunctional diguanylate cyclase/phosphodiesterase [Pseudomonas sp. GD03944]MDH1264396.1 bifunctional diguanylate cyclase/phosphodiesterase [Pseudomonas sp. GD03944]